MNLIKTFISQLVISLLIINNLSSYDKRGMVIAYETGLAENINLTLNQSDSENQCPEGIGPITGTVITALYQEACPILISKQIWKNISDHKAIYNDFVSLDISTLEKKYRSFKRFATSKLIRDFKQELIYCKKLYEKINNLAKDVNCSSKKLEKLLWSDPLFERKNAPENIKDLDFSVINEISLYLLCAHVLDTPYIIKDLEGAYLLLPLSYIRKIIPTYEHKIITEQNKSKILTDSEKKLGLKIDHLKDMANNTKAFSSYNQNQEEIFEKAIYDIFVFKNQTSKPLGWIFYMSGHGNFCQDSHDEIYKEEILINQLQQKYKACKEKLYEVKKLNKYSHISIKNIKNELKHLNKAIQKEKSYLSKLMKISRINGLYKSTFKNILTFFNSNINTKLFCYSSCSSGGQNNTDSFKIDPKKNLIVSYPIISLTLTEALIHNKLPQMKLHFYKDENTYYNYSFDNLINTNKKTVNIITNYNFPHFFNQEISSQITPHIIHHISLWFTKPFDWFHKITKKIKKTYLSNIPLIRPANSSSFKILDNDIISSFTISDSIAKNNKNIEINSDISAIFINTNKIIKKIDIAQGKSTHDFPAIISLLSGKSVHTFSAINAKNYGLADILQGFFPFEELSSAKLFIIKKLTCKDDLIEKDNNLVTFENIIIFNNSLMENNKQRANGIILSKNGITYQALWQAKIGLTHENIKKLSFNYYSNDINRFLAYFDIAPNSEKYTLIST